VNKTLLIALSILIVPMVAQADLVGKEDFDGGDVNLVSSSVPSLDGGAGDYFGPGSRNAWPQGFPSPGMPFSLADDSVFGVSNNGAAFPTDNEGIFGVNSDFDNVFFALSDSDEFLAAQTASWTFDITGYENLVLGIDMGGISNSASGGFAVSTYMTFAVSIDAGPATNLIQVTAVDNPGFVTRPMDVGIASGGGRLLVANGPNGVTKYLADSGSAATDTYLDKTPASGTGQGLMDTFSAPITGTGSTLTITLTADVPFEAAAFDNLMLTGDLITIRSESSSFGSLKSKY
jgi:hypothetical protein